MAAVKKSLSKLEKVFYVAKAVKIIWLKTPKTYHETNIIFTFYVVLFLSFVIFFFKNKKV